MKKKGKVFFHPIDGTGALTISWSSLPKGDAVEAMKGSGVGFFSENGSLLSVIFDEVQSEADHQILEFPRHSVEVTVVHGRVSHTVVCKNVLSKSKKSKQTISKKRKNSIKR